MWTNPQEIPDLVTFTKEIFIGTLHSSCSENVEALLLRKKSPEKCQRKPAACVYKKISDYPIKNCNGARLQ